SPEELSAEEFKRRILECSGEGVAELTLDGQLLSMNAEGRRRMSLPSAEEAAQPDWAAWWPEESRALAEEALATARGGNPGRFFGTSMTASGEPQLWDVVVTPLFDAHGQPERLLVILHDITERQAAEEKFRLLFEHSGDAHLLIHDGVI